MNEPSDGRPPVKNSAGQSENTPARFLSPAPKALSPRQREILRFAANGRTEREIALALHLSIFTVHAHVTQIRRRLDARNMTQAVALALKFKLIDEEVADGRAGTAFPG